MVYISVLIILVVASNIASAQIFNCSNPTKYWTFRTCCKSPRFFSENVLNQCREKFTKKTGNDRASISVNAFFCTAECVFNETNFFVDGRINIENINNTLIKVFNEPLWQTILSTVLPVCIKEVIERQGDLLEQNVLTSTRIDCGYISFFTFACLNLQIFRNCPVPNWVISDKCSKMKLYDYSCSLIPGIHNRL